MLARLVRREVQKAAPHDVQPQQLPVALEEDRPGAAWAVPELAEEAEALSGWQNVFALEDGHLDLAQRQVLRDVDQYAAPLLQRHRPALREAAARVGRPDDLDETVMGGCRRDERPGEVAVRLRFRRISRALRQQMPHQKAEDLPRARPCLADVLRQPPWRHVEVRRRREPPAGGRRGATHLRLGDRKGIEHRDTVPVRRARRLPGFRHPAGEATPLNEMPGRGRPITADEGQQHPPAVQQDGAALADQLRPGLLAAEAPVVRRGLMQPPGFAAIGIGRGARRRKRRGSPAPRRAPCGPSGPRRRLPASSSPPAPPRRPVAHAARLRRLRPARPCRRCRNR